MIVDKLNPVGSSVFSVLEILVFWVEELIFLTYFSCNSFFIIWKKKSGKTLNISDLDLLRASRE